MKYVLLLLLQLHYILSCDRGLTQLRHRDTLALMRCVPTLAGQPDPCIVLTGGRMSWCQQDARDWVCCGTQELLIQLLAGKPSFRSSPDSWYNFASHSQYDYNVVVGLPSHNSPPPIIVTTPTPSTPTAKTTYKPRKTSMSTLSPTPTQLNMLSFPFEERGNFSNSLRLSSNVVAIRDGRCTVIVNTGMPHQRNEIIKNLGVAGISARDVQFVVITSSLAPFIGNLNLFPNAQIVIEQHFMYKEHLITGGIEENVHVEMCSPKTYLVSTPGPSTHSVTVVARNVPTMGTVAITGQLFPKDGQLMGIDEENTQDAALTIRSRREIICQVDWIIPAYAVALPVTPLLKKQANCDNFYNIE